VNHPYPICYLPQKIIPLSASIASNVVYPLPSGDSLKIKEALKRVGLEAHIDSLPHGVETPLGDEGQVLSGGQLQRVLLARLWYHQSPVVLIDEGTSALDPELERLVHMLFRELADRGATLILIAHRPTQIAFADEVISLSQGSLGN
jgi:ATP-binding cassette subfamily B protein